MEQTGGTVESAQTPAISISLSTSSGPAHTAAELLCARGLGLCDQDRWVWRQLDLTIAPGERVALTGPSGSGKTALLRALAGLLPVTEGDIVFDNREQQRWPMPSYRSRVGYLPQRPVLSDGDTVEAVLRGPFAYRTHRHLNYPRAQIEDNLLMLGRDTNFLQRRTESLSGGEQQLAALLRLLALQPSLLLLDEPTASLDRQASDAVEILLNAWRDEAPHRAWLWVGHDAAQAVRMSDRQMGLPWNP
jgi:putative ABC transport system ATP-binding protein